ncbi:hypothetical protein ABBQ38_012719 [Trebouxia sp. C0009 RCD-2024]
MIEVHNGWRMAYSVSSENHTVKIGRGGSDVDLEHHTYEPTYEPLGSADFDTLLDEIAEVVHTQYWKADEAECWEADEARCWEADEAQCWEADEERSCEADEAQCWEADEAATDEMLMMFDSPARLQGPCIRQAAGTHCVRGTELQEQTSTDPVPMRKIKLEEDTGSCEMPPKRVKLEPRTAVKQEVTGSSTQSSHASMSTVKQEPDSCTQPAITMTCTCGGNATRCSAPGCHQLYCQPCDTVLKAIDPAKGFKTCSFHCCMPSKGFSKVQFCAAHYSLLFNCKVCQQVFCKKPCCSQCRLAVCQHCIDSHEEASCGGNPQSDGAAPSML